MTSLDDFFDKPSAPLHPRLRNWKARLGEPGVAATLEVYRHDTDLGMMQPEMDLQFVKDGAPLPPETAAWDDDLNAGLIDLGVRAATPEQEAERFALGLRAALRKAEREVGDGYFNSVLIELIRGSELAEHPEVAAVLTHVSVLPANRQSRAYPVCREMVADTISGRARELTVPLGYPQDEAKRILVSALARYLDERFSVSRRRRLGLL